MKKSGKKLLFWQSIELVWVVTLEKSVYKSVFKGFVESKIDEEKEPHDNKINKTPRNPVVEYLKLISEKQLTLFPNMGIALSIPLCTMTSNISRERESKCVEKNQNHLKNSTSEADSRLSSFVTDAEFFQH
ncbi:hypothetical protein J6590_049811 [Homalodisca vitripennis]|nr:hypothetical protein J6590_049811 [Homalodisca vitripennis]